MDGWVPAAGWVSSAMLRSWGEAQALLHSLETVAQRVGSESLAQFREWSRFETLVTTNLGGCDAIWLPSRSWMG
jgi:hypothetical protein